MRRLFTTLVLLLSALVSSKLQAQTTPHWQQRAVEETDRMTQSLNLTPVQRTKVLNIHARYNRLIDSVKTSSSDYETKKQVTRNLNVHRRKELKRELPNAKYNKYRNDIKEMKARLKARNHDPKVKVEEDDDDNN